MSALQLARDLRCQHKTAFVLMHKLREALASETKDKILHGVVEVDGGYFGGHIRPANLAKDRVDRRLARHQTGKASRGGGDAPAWGADADDCGPATSMRASR